MHLNTDELVDIAEGTRTEAAAPHLASCEPCRAQLCELRAMIAAAKDVDVPEPSPLFWDHLSARVSEAVAADRAGSRFIGGPLAALFASRAIQGILVVAVGLVLALVLNTRALAPAAPPESDRFSFAVAAPPPELLDDVTASGDASLTLVANLTAGLDFDGEREAGLAPRGSAEHAIIHMSDGELRELRRLLKEELQ